MEGIDGTDTNRRKDDHIRICTEKNPLAAFNFLDCIEVVHFALPEIDYDDIDLSTTFMGSRLNAPLMISAMTGGGSDGKRINDNLATGASALGIPLGLGSQRPALEEPALEPTFSLVMEHDIPLVLGNIGIPQLVKASRRGGPDEARRMIERAMDMIGTDVICIHLNYLQEVVQPEGDKVGRGALDVIGALAKDHHIVVKETGGGMSGAVIDSLKDAGVAAVDVGGRGGTSFSAVEFYRNRKRTLADKKALGKLLWDWGIPTPASVVMARGKLPLIATGGVRSGLDAFKLLALGADIVGIAGMLLPATLKSGEEVCSELKRIVRELKAVMFLTGSGTVKDISRTGLVIDPPLSNWME